MSYSPYTHARTAQAKYQSDQQLRRTALMSFHQGVAGAAKCAVDLVHHPLAKIYSLESLIMWRMKVLAREDRMLLDADPKIDLETLADNARAALGQNPSEEAFIEASVAHARSEHEAWKLHFQLTGIHQADLPEERKAKIEAAIASRFPDAMDVE